MALVSVKYQRKKGHHQPFFTVRMSVMPHTPASAPVVKSQVTDSSSSNVDVGAALLWPDPKVQEPAPDPEWQFLQWARCQKMCRRDFGTLPCSWPRCNVALTQT
ncbi:uncharacterized protein LOC144162405 isoform X1 [Haemaphysalis longicornis]